MSLITFLSRVANLKTGEELDGHMSGAEAVDNLSAIILEARTLRESATTAELGADGLQVLRTLRDHQPAQKVAGGGVPVDRAHHLVAGRIRRGVMHPRDDFAYDPLPIGSIAATADGHVWVTTASGAVLHLDP